MARSRLAVSRSSFVRPFASPRSSGSLPASASASTASADFSLRLSTSPFRARGEISPGKVCGLCRATVGSTTPVLDRWSFAILCSLAPTGTASIRFLFVGPRLRSPLLSAPASRPDPLGLVRFAVRSTRCDLLVRGLSPPGHLPCWAHKEESDAGITPAAAFHRVTRGLTPGKSCPATARLAMGPSPSA